MNCDQLSLPVINYTCLRSTIPITDQQSLTMITCPLPVTEMPTSRDLNFSKTPTSSYPTPPRKKRWSLLPIKTTPVPPNRLTAWKKKDFRSLPRTAKLTQSWTEVFRRFPVFSQRIRKVSKVHPSIPSTYRQSLWMISSPHQWLLVPSTDQ